MRTVLLVPRRRDGGWRDELWSYCRERWERMVPDVPIVEGHHDEGPFSRSQAINTAARLAGKWDVGVVIDADVVVRLSSFRAAVAAAASGQVTWAHRRWRGFRRESTERLLRERTELGDEVDAVDVDVLVERTNPLSWSCCVAIPRSTFDELGGFDERFRGWGFEDMAFQSAVCGLFPWGRVESDVFHLWHERSGERITKGYSRQTATREYVVNARLGRRYMVALRRDHGLTDRLAPADADELERDVANLKRDDAGYVGVARRYGLPNWTDWWPTLPELLAGAREDRLAVVVDERPPAVTLVVHSGGTAATWPERSGYLDESLASLTARVHGPIVQRVLYSDWPTELYGELETIATRHGFYVVGDGHHGYSASRARLWRYLERRAVGEYVFATEDDFVYDVDVELEPMIATLASAPYLRQLALLREPYYPRELAAGSIIGEDPASYALVRANGHSRVEHRLYFTANPSLIRRDLTRTPWPTAASSERAYTDVLNRDRRSRFAYWGDGTPAVHHIGAVRAGEPATY